MASLNGGVRRLFLLVSFATTAVVACGGTHTMVGGTAGSDAGAGTTGGGGHGGSGGNGGASGQAGVGAGGDAGAGDRDGGQAGASGHAGGGTGGTGGTGGACASATNGAACTSEGTVCGSCTDPCQNCNTLRCQSGHWLMQESIAGQCFDCSNSLTRCELHTQYCKITTSHIGTTAACPSLPAGCTPTATCACLSNPPLCSQTDAGAVTVTIQAP
jgi:hypothetical protein